MSLIKYYLKLQVVIAGCSLLIGITDPTWYLFYLIMGVPTALCKHRKHTTASIRY